MSNYNTKSETQILKNLTFRRELDAELWNLIIDIVQSGKAHPMSAMLMMHAYMRLKGNRTHAITLGHLRPTVLSQQQDAYVGYVIINVCAAVHYRIKASSATSEDICLGAFARLAKLRQDVLGELPQEIPEPTEKECFFYACQELTFLGIDPADSK